MHDDSIFRTLIIVVVLLGLAVRAYYLCLLKRHTTSDRVRKKESPVNMMLQAFFYIGACALLATYLAYPRLLSWSSLHLPVWLRWTGVMLGFVCLPLLAWVHRCLDLNCSFVLRIREDHTLVTHGPYAWVRHPMYAVWYLLHTSLFLISANWLIGLYLVGIYTIPIMVRMKEEEAMLCEAFGDAYRTYMRRTGRILPRLRRY